MGALTPHPGAAIGDSGPLDICVASEQRIDRADIVVTARVVGGIQLLDDSDADHKIVVVLRNDQVYDGADELDDLPAALVRRIVHRFATYKLIPGSCPEQNGIVLLGAYVAAHARRVIEASAADLADAFGAVSPLGCSASIAVTNRWFAGGSGALGNF